MKLLKTLLILATVLFFVNNAFSKTLLKTNYADTKCTKGKEFSYTMVEECSIVGRFQLNNTHVIWFDEHGAKTKSKPFCNNMDNSTIAQPLNKCIVSGKAATKYTILNNNEPKRSSGVCEYYFYPDSKCSSTYAYKDVLFNNACFIDANNNYKYTSCNATHISDYICEDAACKKNCKIRGTIINGPQSCGAFKRNGFDVYRSFKKY
ncbi:expressed protein [Dictyostelium purpureum]|uniref:Expressed protein n=1 Tax=Dictyostelium purpureum TaxID=5786 RepID=F0ZP11_DICPU|nr:uncharacterized protein DICPUDRAFT_92243 [Dictyostelium purpureum]EGC34316.1 expressed protein [Dictyostelium purpureum]|eukprot:XP_003289152.1 expressed protein [Dictyostelium purpureum]